MKRLLQIDPRDNVAIALEALVKGETAQWENGSLQLLENIPQGHKCALGDLPPGALLLRYGHPIGRATGEIQAGSWVHSHNLATTLTDPQDYLYSPILLKISPVPQVPPTFQGYRRIGGQCGIRNDIWVLSLSGCANQFGERLVQLARERFASQLAAGNISNIQALGHPYGCSQLGEDFEATKQILAKLARHPNAAGVLLVSLGCENNQMAEFLAFLSERRPERLRSLVIQEAADEFADGLARLTELVECATAFKPEAIPLTELIVGLKCGGSDGFSGITANPLVGRVVDQLIAAGAGAILSEIPESFGAEELLMARAADKTVFAEIVTLINNFKAYYEASGQPIYENPSPGNKAGGITTLEEKSLGCILKGGSSAVVDVLSYGESLQKKGLNLLEGPGNDLVSCTALAAAGAHLILFTTGRGNPLGAPVPTLKIASNSDLARRKPGWIDFDAGALLDGANLATLTGQLFAKTLAIASGELTCNETNGYREMAIWKNGVTL
jgi:altronate hydrolase